MNSHMALILLLLTRFILASDIFKPSSINYAQFELSQAAPRLPKSAWHNILSNLEDIDLLEASYTCRLFNAMIHHPDLDLFAKLDTENNALAVILGSDMTITMSHIPLIKKHLENFSPSIVGPFLLGLPYRVSDQKVLEQLYMKEFDPGSEVWKQLPSPTFYLPELFFSNVYEVITPNILANRKRERSRHPIAYYYWLPSNESQQLFDILDLQYQLIPAVMTLHTNKLYSRFFVPAIISQYIIPAWRKEQWIPDALKKIAPFISEHCSFYFRYLFYALYLENGSFSSPQFMVFYRFLKNVGLVYSKLGQPIWKKGPLVEMINADEMPMLNVLRIAKHWGLDMKKIIKAANQNNAVVNAYIEDRTSIRFKPVSPYSVLECCLEDWAGFTDCRIRKVNDPLLSIENPQTLGMLIKKVQQERSSGELKRSAEDGSIHDRPHKLRRIKSVMN